ncbi:uncharacterized protein LOC124696606 [Lolium rigidum]|uniref:uncharacterized protein LOC124696606 n=1 Tax=Lolium rigidum TaxID=89674 RepID=UPI001F5C5B8C|nr:uncharacterized protein LOC124696606 [Lolium rigidum]
MSSRKRFSLPVVLAFLLALIFLAGTGFTVHHKDHSNLTSGSRTGKVSEDPGAVSRKLLRIVHGAKQAKKEPSGGKALPRGIVHGTSNLEMVSMVGDPENQHGGSSSSKSLLAIPVGIKNKAAVDKLVSKFPADRFTLMVFHYDGAGEDQWDDLEWSRRAVHVSARGQTKWWFAKRFLHPDIVAEYDYVFLWDEDVEVDAFDPVRYLDIVKREGLEVSQPALDRQSEIHHGITARATTNGGGDVHRRFYKAASALGGGGCDDSSTGPPCTGWVEMMVPVFSRAAWRCSWGMVQNDLVHAWGLDYKLGYCAQGDRTLKVGVVDSEYVLHRGVPMLGGTEGKGAAFRAAVRRRSHAEMQIFDRRWKEAAANDASWTDPYQ